MCQFVKSVLKSCDHWNLTRTVSCLCGGWARKSCRRRGLLKPGSNNEIRNVKIEVETEQPFISRLVTVNWKLRKVRRSAGKLSVKPGQKANGRKLKEVQVCLLDKLSVHRCKRDHKSNVKVRTVIALGRRRNLRGQKTTYLEEKAKKRQIKGLFRRRRVAHRPIRWIGIHSEVSALLHSCLWYHMVKENRNQIKAKFEANQEPTMAKNCFTKRPKCSSYRLWARSVNKFRGKWAVLWFSIRFTSISF